MTLFDRQSPNCAGSHATRANWVAPHKHVTQTDSTHVDSSHCFKFVSPCGEPVLLTTMSNSLPTVQFHSEPQPAHPVGWFDWADDVESNLEQITDAASGGLAPVTNSVFNHTRQTSELFSRQVPHTSGPAGVPNTLQEWNSGRRAGRQHFTTTTGLPSLHFGMPVGPMVVSLAWTDTQLSYGSDTIIDRTSHSWHQALTGYGGGIAKFNLPNSLSSIHSEADCAAPFDIGVPANGKWIKLDLGTVAIHLHQGGTDAVSAIALTGTPKTLSVADPAKYADLLVLLGGLQHWLTTCTTARATAVVLTDCPMSVIKKEVSRTIYESTPRSYTWPVAGISSANRYPTIDESSTLVNHFYIDQCGTVCQGRVAADEVPPATIIFYGANGGKSITGSTLVVSLGPEEHALVTSTRTSSLPIQRLRRGTKVSPVFRDTLVSPIACAALREHVIVGGGNEQRVCVMVDDHVVSCRTVYSDAFSSADDEITVWSRDPVRLLEGLHDLAAVLDLECENVGRGSFAFYCKSIDKNRRINVRYGGCSKEPRWSELVGSGDLNSSPGDSPDSEIRLDYGCSGLGRGLLRSHTLRGGFISGRKIWVDRKGHFSALVATCRTEKAQYSTSRGLGPVDYIVDMEYITRRTNGELERYVYALGLVKLVRGSYVGSTCIVDDAEGLAEILAPYEREAENYRELVKTGIPMNMADVLEQIKVLNQDPHVRMYAKGKDAEASILASKRVGGTRLFQAQKGIMAELWDLGPLVDRYEPIGARLGYGTSHNPARECVAFAVAGGLCFEAPNVSEIGHDRLRTLLLDSYDDTL